MSDLFINAPTDGAIRCEPLITCFLMDITATVFLTNIVDGDLQGNNIIWVHCENVCVQSGDRIWISDVEFEVL